MLWHLVIEINKISSINFWVKFASFYILSPCAWLVKWHNCIMTNCVNMGITEELFVEAVCSKTAPAVFRVVFIHLECFPYLGEMFELLLNDYLNDILCFTWLKHLCDMNNKTVLNKDICCSDYVRTGSGCKRSCKRHNISCKFTRFFYLHWKWSSKPNILNLKCIIMGVVSGQRCTVRISQNCHLNPHVYWAWLTD